MNPTDYLTSLVAPLLTYPEDLRVTSTTDNMGVLLTVDVHKDDMGVIIGKAGETARTIRHLVRIVGIKGDARVSMKINEPEGSDYKPRN
jgi:predicted RNA-binding protein YlqC (UPF0109 family)